MSNNWYLNNPWIHAERKLANSSSPWVRQFACTSLRPLIICRGPIRKEAMDVFDEMGIDQYGILLSEKDSITYTNALAPELRKLTDPERVHRVPDYTGASREERLERIAQIISIAHDNNYNAIFAGYGFMAEDEEMVRSMEEAGLNFIGPCSQTQRGAGLKDEAKRTALQVDVSVTPGVDNATALTLLASFPDTSALKALAAERELSVADEVWQRELEAQADGVLEASYRKGIDLITVEDLAAQLQRLVVGMYDAYPDNRIRLKAISGGGGKGQRILAAPSSYAGSKQEQIAAAVESVPGLVREILAEVKCNGVGDNKNVLAELNIETTRHQEIQVVGNGDWCITMGGRDCSLQMHEQKLLEVSVTVEELTAAIAVAQEQGRDTEANVLRNDLNTLMKMEEEGSRFGAAVGLDSVATFECIVDGNSHFFMEMNTRIQVEHRVTELCYSLQFSNPDNADDFFVVHSLVEVMALLATHGKNLPQPQRIPRVNCSVEARLNATNHALQPHAGGVIKRWSDAIEGEIRDDQGISLHNPDTDVFMEYHLAGAYDSNIALLLTTGAGRMETYQAMAETLRRTSIDGNNLATNLEFHYGLVNWFIGNGINARPTTRFVVPYLTAVGQLKQQADNADLAYSYQQITRASLASYEGEAKQAATQALALKQSLLLRPIEMLFAQPHSYSGWLSINQKHFEVTDGVVKWLCNPVHVLADTYHYLNMDYVEGEPALGQIWDHDNQLLQRAENFYEQLETQLDEADWQALQVILQGPAPQGFDDELWQQVQSSHAGFQLGCDILSVLPFLAEQTAFFGLAVKEDLSLEIPSLLDDVDLQKSMAKVLVPPPVAKSDEIVASSGGMFYSREAPGMPPFLEVGSHFDSGDPLYIVEVMKMFNKVSATFSGTIDAVLIDTDGVIIKKGDPLFKITPDETLVVENEKDIAARMRASSDLFLSTLKI